MLCGAIVVAGFAAILAVEGARLTIEVYYDILGAIHLILRAGERTPLSNIGHRARVPNNRLKNRMRELAALGFGDTETRTYDKSDRLASVLFNYGTFSTTVSYASKRDGYQASLKDSAGVLTTYAYDAAGRLVSIKDPEGSTTSYSYDRDSRMNRTVKIGGVKQVTLYDRASRTTTMYANNTSGTLETLAYTYDPTGYRLSQQDTAGQTTTTTTYAYDRQHRLNLTIVNGWKTYDRYDAVGNLAAETTSLTRTYTYDADNELTMEQTSPTIYILYDYDRNGNRIDALPWDGGGENFYFDYENRLRATSLGCNYTYAPTGERTSTKCGGSPTYSGYDYGTGGASNVIASYNATGVRQQRFTHSAGVDTPTELYAFGTHYAYETDALGSVKRITDANGNTVNTYAYDAWGNPTQNGSLSNPFEFAAREWDSTNALYFNRARFYDPSAAGGHRFLGADPAGGGYAYAGNSPANFVDPTGMDPVPSSTPPPAGLTWQQKCLLSGGCDPGGGATGDGSVNGNPIFEYLGRCAAEATVFVLGIVLSVLGAYFMYSMLEANAILEIEAGVTAAGGGGAAAGSSLAMDIGAIVEHWNDPWAVAGGPLCGFSLGVLVPFFPPPRGVEGHRFERSVRGEAKTRG